MIMRRKLYLIISDGGGNTPLRGVHIDKDNFLNFFKSPEVEHGRMTKSWFLKIMILI